MPDAFLAVIAVGLHNGESILVSRMWLLHRNTPCAEYPQPICALGNLSRLSRPGTPGDRVCPRDVRSCKFFTTAHYAGQASFGESQPGWLYCGRCPSGTSGSGLN